MQHVLCHVHHINNTLLQLQYEHVQDCEAYSDLSLGLVTTATFGMNLMVLPNHILLIAKGVMYVWPMIPTCSKE